MYVTHFSVFGSTIEAKYVILINMFSEQKGEDLVLYGDEIYKIGTCQKTYPTSLTYLFLTVRLAGMTSDFAYFFYL